MMDTLRDGFQELSTYAGGHKRIVRGCEIISLVDERSQNLRNRDCVLSWDANCVLLWENGSVIQDIKFPKSKECFISCIAYITKLNVFFGPSMDMSFNIYDQRFRMIESISHEERVILGCHYDVERDLLIMSGGSGVSVWRIRKCTSGSQLETSNSFLVEKLFVFEGCSDWVSKLIYEPLQSRAYAISNSNVTLLDFTRRVTECIVSDLHETPITACLWYPADKFFITADMSGIIRCWFIKGIDDTNEQESEDAVVAAPNAVVASLHSFNAHSKAVSGIFLHPLPGLLITAGMDSCVKVFDLEAFTPIQSIQTGDGITHFSVGDCFGSPVCLFAHVSGDLVMWKIESCCREVATCTSDVISLVSFANMNEFYTLNRSQICYDEGDARRDGIGFEKFESTAKLGADGNNVHVASHRKDNKEANTQDPISTRALPQYIVDLSKTIQEKLPPILSQNASKRAEDEIYNDNFQKNNVVIAFAGHDLQVLAPTGSVVSRCTADNLMDGVTHFTFSVFQQLMFCLFENGSLRVFCTRSAVSILLREIFVGALTADKAMAIVLVEGMSLGALRSSSTSKDMRGEPSPMNVNEAIVIGTAEGVLLCFDTFQECALVSSQQISKGEVEGLKYSHTRNELTVVAKSSVSSVRSTVKIFRVPDMVLTHSVQCENMFTCMDVSAVEHCVIVGSKQGVHQFFRFFDAADSGKSIDTAKRYNVNADPTNTIDGESSFGHFTEVLHCDSSHTGAVTGISVCDKLKVYATSALDSAIKFWDFKKRCLKTILLDSPSRDVLFNWPLGHLVVTQREKLQSIAYDSWRAEQSGGDSERGDEWDDDDSEPQSSPSTSTKKTSRLNTSKPSSGGVTFLTDQDKDEMAEMAFLEAALLADGNLDDYWKNHSSVGYGRKKNSSRKARLTSKDGQQVGGVQFDVRNPVVPIPPRRTKSNFFRRKKEKELAAQMVPPIPPEGLLVVAHSTDEHDDSDDEPDMFATQRCAGAVDASALEDLVGRTGSRGESSGRSLLLKTKSFVRKFSVSGSNDSAGNGNGKGSSANTNALKSLRTVQSATAGKGMHSNPSGTALASFLEKKRGSLQSVQEEEEEVVELFVKPNGPRGRQAFQRVRPRIAAVTALSAFGKKSAQAEK